MHHFTPLAALIGGAIIGLSASIFFLGHGRICGISGLFGGLVRRTGEVPLVRLAFLLGLLAAGLVLRFTAPALVASTWAPSLLVAAPAGILVGFGTQLGNGCTSGHGICGVSRLSARSMVATLTFMAAGFGTVFVVRHILGGSQ
jgi:uncharacterized membrane protein YedE/YeeE